MKMCVKRIRINNVGAGELLDVGNILTSPDLLRTVGLPVRKTGYGNFTANQEGSQK
jgi:hypothetical protein